MKNANLRFCKIYNNFYGSEISNVNQLYSIQNNGEELSKFCDFYFRERINQSGLKHFYRAQKAKYIAIGMTITIISILLLILVLF